MKEYIVKHIDESLIDINTEELTSVWAKANVNSDFSFPWEKCDAPQTSFRALFDEENFYFRFDVQDDNILTYVDENHKMDVVNSDRVEIFFCSDDKLNPYYCLEMDAKSRILDYKAEHYRNFDFQWQWPAGQENLNVKAFQQENKYIVQGSIKLKSLEELNLLKNNQLKAGLYRGLCMALPKAKGDDADLRWISWVKPDAVEPDFHIASSFGLLTLKKD